MRAIVNPQFIWDIAAFMCFGGLVGIICAAITGAVVNALRKRSFAAACVGGFCASFPGGTLAALVCGLSQLPVLLVTGLSTKGSHAPMWVTVWGWLSLVLVIAVAALTAVMSLPGYPPKATTPTRFRRWASLAFWSLLGSFVGVGVTIFLRQPQDQTEVELAIYPGIVLGVMSAAIWHFATTNEWMVRRVHREGRGE